MEKSSNENSKSRKQSIWKRAIQVNSITIYTFIMALKTFFVWLFKSLSSKKQLMELLQSPMAISCGVVALMCIFKFLSWVWFSPKKLEKSLRKQGFSGNPYRSILGDFGEIIKMEKESLSKPINFSNDIVPRIMPFIHKITTNYGMSVVIRVRFNIFLTSIFPLQTLLHPI